MYLFKRSRKHKSVDTRTRKDSHRDLWTLAGIMLGGVFCIGLYASVSNDSQLGIFSIGVLLAGASLFGGGSIGFLFAIPRSIQNDQVNRRITESSESGRGNDNSSQLDYRANTNLEQISDWLTKTLVGVSLVQASEIKSEIISLCKFASKGLGSDDKAEVLAFVLITFYFIVGFLFGYLWTRLFLEESLRLAGEVVDQINERHRIGTEQTDPPTMDVSEETKQVDSDYKTDRPG